MKMVFSLRKHNYIARASISLIAVALVVGTLGCAGGAVRYSLTMAANPVAGGTATDLAGASPYAAGDAVSIEAVAAAGYRFADWTALAGTFGNPNAAGTNFTMPAQDVTVTANFVEVYNLTVAVAPPGSGTATDLTNASPYAAGDAISIKAVAAAGYRFVNWTAPAGTFANRNAAETTFTVPAQDVSVTANFVRPLDHFTCYWVDNQTSIGEVVYLEDQFGAVNTTVGGAMLFCNPVEKQYDEVLTPISNPDHHLMIYHIPRGPKTWRVEVDNQFGAQNLTVSGPVMLAVPTQKLYPGDHEPPVGLDHYLLYKVIAGPSIDVVVDLNDQFGEQLEVQVCYEPAFFANPVQKTYGDTATEIVNPEAHLVFYWIYGDYFEREVGVVNQFATQNLTVSGPDLLAVPSKKSSYKPISYTLAAGGWHTVGLESDGTVVAVGDNGYGQSNVGDWTNIIQVAAGEHHTVALQPDGTVVAVGNNESGQCDITGWTGITQVAAGGYHTVGLKSDGTVVAVGDNESGQCNITDWTGITQVAAGGYHTVGLRSDGRVVAVGYNVQGQCNVGNWTGITQVTAGGYHTVGLRSDGIVVAVGDNGSGQGNVDGWTNIIQVAAGGYHTVGLRSDGTVVAVGRNNEGQSNVSGWTNIIQVATGLYHTVGLRADGTVVAVGNNDYGQRDVSGWDLD